MATYTGFCCIVRRKRAAASQSEPEWEVWPGLRAPCTAAWLARPLTMVGQYSLCLYYRHYHNSRTHHNHQHHKKRSPILALSSLSSNLWPPFKCQTFVDGSMSPCVSVTGGWLRLVQAGAVTTTSALLRTLCLAAQSGPGCLLTLHSHSLSPLSHSAWLGSIRRVGTSQMWVRVLAPDTSLMPLPTPGPLLHPDVLN